MLQLCLTTGESLILKELPARKFKGQKIPGSSLYMTERDNYSVAIHLYSHPLFKLSLRQFRFSQNTRVIIKEQNDWLRLEVSISGNVIFLGKDGETTQLNPGQYHLTRQTLYASDFQSEESTHSLVIYYSDLLLEGIGSIQAIVECPPRPTAHEIMDMVHEMMKCPYNEDTRSFYYANKVREILFSHAVSLPVALPGELSKDQVAAMYEADRIMANNLDGQITIPELARKLGTNFVTLKKNYEKVFGIGIFPRMMQRKMEHIQRLLESTNLPLKEIADQAGYQTLPGFINAFRKRFNITPKEWRKKRRGL